MEEKETQNNTQNTNSQKEPNKRRFKPRNQKIEQEKKNRGKRDKVAITIGTKNLKIILDKMGKNSTIEMAEIERSINLIWN